MAGYVALNIGALLTGVELGIQPLLFRDAGGHALYFPYGLESAIFGVVGVLLARLTGRGQTATA